MERNFLSNLKVGDAALPDVVIDAIMEEHKRDLEAVKADPGANGGSGGKVFTQEEVNRIVSERLKQERSKVAPPQDDEREQALKAREARLDCRDYLDRKKYPAALLDVLDTSDAGRFQETVEALAGKFPGAFTERPTPPPYAAGTGHGILYGNSNDPVANAFKPQT